MNDLFLENKIFIIQAIIQTNKDFEKESFAVINTSKPKIDIKDKTKELLNTLEVINKKLLDIDGFEHKNANHILAS